MLRNQIGRVKIEEVETIQKEIVSMINLQVMDNKIYLDGDDNSFVEIVRDYKDGLILYLDSFVRNIAVAEELAEDTFVRLNTTDNNNVVAANQNIDAEEKPDAQIVSEDNNGQKGADTNPVNGFCDFWWKNKLNVSGTLYSAIENNPDSVFAILATYRPTTADITSFTYEGKTLAKWAAEAFEENASQDAKKGYELAYNAYLETVLPSAVSWLSENNIKCERASYINNGLTLFATAGELENLPLEDLGNWYFDLDSGNLKGTSNIETDASGFQAVN